MKSGYSNAIELALKKLEALDKERVCEITGASFENGEYVLPWFNMTGKISEGPDFERIVKLHYLISEGGKRPTGQLIAFREVPGALFYDPKFIARAVTPLVKAFGNNPENLIKTAQLVGGREAKAGDAAVKIDILPFMPVTYIIWGKDDENEASGSVLFDKSAPGWLAAEDLVVLASLGTYKLLSLLKG